MYCIVKQKFRIVIVIMCVLQISLTLFSILLILRDHQCYAEYNFTLTDISNCSLSIVESIIDGLDYPDTIRYESIYKTLSNLIDNAETSIHIVSFYWSLNDDNFTNLSTEGRNVYQNLVTAAKDRNVTIKIIENEPCEEYKDTKLLSDMGLAEVRRLNVTKFLGAGILHTKMFIFDNKHILLGSFNIDWKAFSQRLEVNIAIYNCDGLASDAMKIFQVYWYLTEENATIPDQWPPELSPRYNMQSPLNIEVNNNFTQIYLASSPQPFCPKGQTEDLTAILDIINSAEKSISVCVAEYAPLMLYREKPRFWPVIDNALRKMAIDNEVEVRLLIGHKNGSTTDDISEHYLKSLSQIYSADPSVNIKVKIYTVPEEVPEIPDARNLHSKYMVTDKAAYIGTSNWSGDYFVNSTAGVSVTIKETGSRDARVRNSLTAIFNRDWNSRYAKTLP